MPNTTRCVACSTVQKKGAVTIMKGSGDHTWIETIHLEHEEYKAYVEAENKLRKTGNKLFEPTDEPSSDLPHGFSEVKLDKE